MIRRKRKATTKEEQENWGRGKVPMVLRDNSQPSKENGG